MAEAEIRGIMAKEKTSGIYFKVTDEERSLIEQRMALMGVHNMSAYIRKPGKITAYLKRMTTGKGMDKMKRYATILP